MIYTIDMSYKDKERSPEGVEKLTWWLFDRQEMKIVRAMTVFQNSPMKRAECFTEVVKRFEEIITLIRNDRQNFIEEVGLKARL